MPQWASTAPAELLPGWQASWPTVPKATCSVLLHLSTPQSSYCHGKESPAEHAWAGLPLLWEPQPCV